jgi:hypothetical protein
MLTKATSADTCIQPTAASSPISDFRTTPFNPGEVGVTSDGRWGAMEIGIVTTLSTLMTVATTAAAYLYYRLRKNAESGEDGLHLKFAKP